MPYTQQGQNFNERTNQIKKLLEAIANYQPTQQQEQSMKKAKRQMLKNIERKYNNSTVNTIYKFPFKKNPFQQDSQEQQNDFILSKQNLQYQNLYEQNFIRKKGLSKEKEKSREKRQPLEEKNGSNQNNYVCVDSSNLKNQTSYIKNKKKQPIIVLNLTQPVNGLLNGPNRQTKQKKSTNITKKQVTLNGSTYGHKKSKSQLREQRYENKSENKQQKSLILYQHSSKQNHFTYPQFQQPNKIREKLKIKSHSTYQQSNKSSKQLRTQNNINYNKNYYNTQYINHKNVKQIATDEKYKFQQNQKVFKETIFQQNERLEDESVYFSSKCNELIDENAELENPKQLFNVSYLKQKLKQSNNQFKTDQVKKHKRNVTQGDMDIKIKLFTNQSYSKPSNNQKSFKRKQITVKLFDKNVKQKQTKISQKQGYLTGNNNFNNSINKSQLFNKNEFNCMMNRTLSNLSQSSAKKGIKILSKSKSKMEDNNSLSKSISKLSCEKYPAKKDEEKQDLRNFTVHVKTDYSHQKSFNTTKSKLIKNQKQNNINQNQRTSKINSIMQGLKQGYKNKNKSKNSKMNTKTGIKTTIRS